MSEIKIEWDGKSAGTIIIDNPNLDGTFLKIEGAKVTRIDFDEDGNEVTLE